MNRPPLPTPTSFNNNLRGSNNGNPMNQIPQQQQQQQQQFFCSESNDGGWYEYGDGDESDEFSGADPSDESAILGDWADATKTAAVPARRELSRELPGEMM